MVFNFTTTAWRLIGGANETSINTNHLACTWKVEMKRENSIKEEGSTETGGSNKEERKTVALKTDFVIKSERNI